MNLQTMQELTDKIDNQADRICQLDIENKRLKSALINQKRKLEDINRAMGLKDPEFAKVVWEHALRDLDKALTSEGEG